VREVPDWVRLKAEAQGNAGRHWVEHLDELVEELEEAWEITVVEALRGGTESYVAVVRTHDGSDAVIKILLPGHDSGNEARTLRAAQGHGYVELLAYDEDRRAMLLERLGSRLRERELSVERELRILTETLLRAWDVPPDPTLELLSDKGPRLVREIRETWESLGRPCRAAVIDAAVELAESRLAAGDNDVVLLHGDAHANNALQAIRAAEFKLVDPDGLIGERAYDLGILIRDLPEGVAGRKCCALLASLTGVDPDAIWAWGFVERVSTGLYCLEIGASAAGREILSGAEEWLDA
jgi:streptomycin 6-kinase